MKNVIEFPLEDGSNILVEVDAPEQECTIPVGTWELPEKASKTFEQAFRNIVPVTRSIIHQIHSLPSQPDEIEVAFGFNVSAEAGVLIASASTAANFSVVLKWSQKKNETSNS